MTCSAGLVLLYFCLVVGAALFAVLVFVAPDKKLKVGPERLLHA